MHIKATLQNANKKKIRMIFHLKEIKVQRKYLKEDREKEALHEMD